MAMTDDAPNNNASATHSSPTHHQTPQEAMTQASSSTSQLPNSPKSKLSPGDTHNTSTDAEITSEQDTSLHIIDLTPAGNSADDQEAHSESLGVSSDTANQDDDAWDHDLKRVKVYELIGSTWADQGTAFCCGSFQEDTGDALLIARSEGDHDSIVLSTTIRPNDVYQRQQETLIVWTEPDGTDYALSFQEAEGCLEVWNFILEVQRYLNGPDRAPSSSPIHNADPSITTANIIRLGHLPQPALGNISEIDKAIKALARTQAIKERLCDYIQREDYIKGLIDVMNQAEDLESIENLHALCLLMQTILMLNDHGMYEHILDDDLFYGVVGMLEYDPEFPAHKANYRDFLKNTLRFHNPIPIPDESIRRKIHHAYRLLFLKDVVLVRVLDDSTFNVLNSCIIFNQIDIITYVQQDPGFLSSIVKLYVDDDMLSGGGVRAQNGEAVPETAAPTAPNARPNPSPAHQTEVILLIQQLCGMAKTVQLPARLALFRSLVDRGILFAVQWALTLPESNQSLRPAINAAGEIFSALLEHDLLGVRGHVVKQIAAIEKEVKAGKSKSETLLKALCRTMARSSDLAVQCLIGDSLKAWLDTPLPDSDPRNLNGMKQRDDAGTERFLDAFYDSCAPILFDPFQSIPEWKSLNEPIIQLTRDRTNLFLYLCELLHTFEQHHSFRSHTFILKSDIALRVATLLKAKDKHLRHAAFRFYRSCLRPLAAKLRQHFMRRDIFRPILELTLQECKRDSLLSSSCQDFFETMRRDNMKEAINHCMTCHGALVRKLADTPLAGQRFQLFIRRWEMNNEPMPETASPLANPNDLRKWPGHPRNPETEEESYFNADDDDDDDELSSSSSPSSHPPTTLMRSLQQAQFGLKRRRRATAAPAKGYRPAHLSPLKTPSLSTLVDYGEEEEDAEFIGPMPDARDWSTSGADGLPLSSETLKSPPPIKHKLDEDEDSVLESLVQGQKTSPVASTSSGPPSPISTSPVALPLTPRTSEKRRRDEEDTDMSTGLRSHSRKRSRGNGSFTQTPSGSHSVSRNGVHPASNGTMNPGDDPPRKIIKVSLGAGATAVAQGLNTDDSAQVSKGHQSPAIDSHKIDSPSPVVPPAIVKDGDSG